MILKSVLLFQYNEIKELHKKGHNGNIFVWMKSVINYFGIESFFILLAHSVYIELVLTYGVSMQTKVWLISSKTNNLPVKQGKRNKTWSKLTTN